MNRKSCTITDVAAAGNTAGATSIRFRSKRVLAIAVAAGALLALSASAYAEPNPVDPGVRCAAKIGPGQYEFYLPGAKVTDVNGNRWVCGPDGQWFKDYSAVKVSHHRVSQVVSAALTR